MSGVTTGLVNIRDALSDCKSAIRNGKANVDYIVKVINDIEDTIKHMNVMSVFMFESINRVLDCSKTQTGMKLVAKNETMSISDTLSLPITCMREIQSKIQIEFLPLDKNICSHIITDKQWFQENMLCLLSNAVKYSSEGIITISMTTVNQTTALKSKQKDQANKGKSILEDGETRERDAKFESTRLRFSTVFRQYSTRRVGIEDATDPKPDIEMSSIEGIQQSHKPADETLPKRKLSSSNCTSAKTQLTASLYVSTKSFLTSSLHKSREKGITPLPNTSVIQSRPLPSSNTNTNNMMLLVEVQDTGIGISQEVMDELFSPFKQAQRLAGGTGLGLYSLAQRVEALNGSYGVKARSDGKRGSKFWFTIPYRADKIASKQYTSKIENVAKQNDLSFDSAQLNSDLASQLSNYKVDDSFSMELITSGKFLENGSSSKSFMSYISGSTENRYFVATMKQLNILLVDDSYAILRLVGKMLRKCGHQVTEVLNGAEALTILENVRDNKEKISFDVVIVDLQMPVMDGKYYTV